MSTQDRGQAAKPLVLVADDERHIARLIQINLERAGFEVLLAYDGVEALEKLAEPNTIEPAVFVLDQSMPRMDGLELLRKLDEEYPEHGPVLIMTTREGVSQFDPYGEKLVKPFNPREVVDWVKRAIMGDDGNLPRLA